MAGEKKRLMKMWCPCLSKIVSIMAWEEQRVDLGSVSGAFGLDPATLKLNGHFISRGVDLIASSVTWKSLVSFFSARGLSIGDSNSGALIVEGKLSKVGSKRTVVKAFLVAVFLQDHTVLPAMMRERDFVIIPTPSVAKDLRRTLSPQVFLSIKRAIVSILLYNYACAGVALNLKRKLCLDEAALSKRRRTNEYASGRQVDFPDRALLCSLTSEKLKRVRDDETVVAAPLKKIKII